MAEQREDTWLVVLSVDNVNMGTWDTFSGAETDSEDSKFRPGGMGRELSLGGRQSLGNATLSRHHDDWLWSQQSFLRRACGQARVTIGRVPMNARGQQTGPPEWLGGTLKTFTPPDHDSMGSDAAMAEIECVIDSVS